ncbi:MAG: exported protein of unknown function [Candidatus Thorarchaeota archaeon]|nr:MAG: exported protein of unknown function [Candidatus Thorarchaeota archaeon]
MKIRSLVLAIITIILCFSGVSPLTIPNSSHSSDISFQEVLCESQLAYDGNIPMDITTIVGKSNSKYIDALNYISSIPLNIQSRNNLTASGMLLPDHSTNFQTPIEEWTELLDNQLGELVYIGTAANPVYANLGSIANEVYNIPNTDPYAVASEIADTFFVGTDTAVIAYANPTLEMFETTNILTSSDTLSGYSLSTHDGESSSYWNWEYQYSITPSGGGIAVTLENDDPMLYFDLLVKSIYDVPNSYGYNEIWEDWYEMDYPYVENTVYYPYEEFNGDTWFLHVIDFEDYSRYVALDFTIKTFDANFYEFTVEPGEDCRIDFSLDVTGGERLVGLNVLGPSGQLVLDTNRYWMFTDYPEFGEVDSIQASLAHPEPGTYKVYVGSGESFSVSYDLSISKQTLNQKWLASELSCSNAAVIASHTGSPILYVDDSTSLPAATMASLSNLEPSRIYLVDPMKKIPNQIIGKLQMLTNRVELIDSIPSMHRWMANVRDYPLDQGNFVLFDSHGDYFAPSALIGAQKHAAVVPFSYNNSKLMTLSQIPEQISYHREFLIPFTSVFSFRHVWTSLELTDINPPFGAMFQLAMEFRDWMKNVAQVKHPDEVVTVGPFRGPGVTLPVSFERAISGWSTPSRYPSATADATCVQVMRSLLRVPLQTLPSRSIDALGSYLIYSQGQTVYNANHDPATIDNSNQFHSTFGSAGLNPTMQVGPSVTTSLESAPYCWFTSTHGGVGDTLYSDDGVLTLWNFNAFRGYEAGGSSSHPDADGDSMVAPSHDSYTGYNTSDIIGSNDLRGMFTMLDACQVGSSYCPATILEAGGGSVVSSWSDTLLGPADCFEAAIADYLIDWNLTLGEALLLSLDETSHCYSTGEYVDDTYILGSNIHIIGASAEQFVIFGDSGISIYDWDANPYPVVDRLSHPTSLPLVKVHPNSTYVLDMGIADPVGNVYAAAGDYQFTVDKIGGSQLISGAATSDGTTVAQAEIDFSSSAEHGYYLVSFSKHGESTECTFLILLENFSVELIGAVVSTAVQAGFWLMTIEASNNHDVNYIVFIDVRFNDASVYTNEVTLLPGMNNFEIQFEALSFTTGTQEIEICMIDPVSNTELQILHTTASFSPHWASYLLVGGLGIFPVIFVLIGIVHFRTSGAIKKLREAHQYESELLYSKAFTAYKKAGAKEAAYRVGEKAGLPLYVLGELGPEYIDRIRQSRGISHHPIKESSSSTFGIPTRSGLTQDSSSWKKTSLDLEKYPGSESDIRDVILLTKTFETDPSTAGHRVAQWFIGGRVQGAIVALDSMSKFGRKQEFAVMYEVLLQDIREAAERAQGEKRDYLLSLLRTLARES